MSVISTPCIDAETLDPVEGQHFEFTSAEFNFLGDNIHLDLHRWPVLVFTNLPDLAMEKYRQSFRLWLEQDYELRYDTDYHFSVIGRGSLLEDHLSLCIWFHNMEHYVMIKMQYG